MTKEFIFKKIKDPAKQLKRAIKSAFDHDGYVDIPPFQFDIEPTKKCNLKCRFCARSYWDKSLNSESDITEEIIEKAEPLFKYCSASALQGLGEPLLYKDFFKLHELAKKHEIYTLISSNCSLLSREMCDKIISEKLDHITLSIDGTKSLKKLRGIEYSTVSRNVERLVLLKEEKKVKSPRLYIEVILTLINLDELTEIVEFADSLSIRTIVVYHPEIYGNELLKFSFYNDLNLTKKIFTKAAGIAKKAGIDLILPDLDIKTKTSYSSGDNRINKTYCDYPFSYLMVDNKGNVSPCCIGCVDDNKSRITVGNLNKDDILSIWNGNKMRLLRKEMLKNKPSGLCKACPVKGNSSESFMRLLNLRKYFRANPNN